jgi:hypothetical protein
MIFVGRPCSGASDAGFRRKHAISVLYTPLFSGLLFSMSTFGGTSCILSSSSTLLFHLAIHSLVPYLLVPLCTQPSITCYIIRLLVPSFLYGPCALIAPWSWQKNATLETTERHPPRRTARGSSQGVRLQVSSPCALYLLSTVAVRGDASTGGGAGVGIRVSSI